MSKKCGNNKEEQIQENELVQNKEEEIQEEKSVQNEEVNETIKLKIKIGFIDKYNESIYYKADNIVEFEKTRAEELLKDPRKLVCICK